MEVIEDKIQEIPDNKQFVFPNNIVFREYSGYMFVVSVDTANWLILNNKEELDFFNLLKNNPLDRALSLYSGSLESAESVVAQIVGRDFECIDVRLKSNESSLHLYLTNACNLRCPHCYMFAGKKNTNELTYSEITDIIKASASHGVTHMILSGGEILLCNDLLEYINLAYNLGINVELLTNGTLITEDFAANIKEKVSRVQISIDGYDEHSNSLIRGEGNFERALASVDILTQYSINVDIGITPRFHKSLHKEIDKFVNFFHYLQDRYSDKIVVAFTSALFDGRELKLTDEDKIYYSQCVTEITNRCFGEMNKDIGFVKFHSEHGVDENCAYGNLTISSNGDIYFCSQITPMKPLGNIRTLGIENAFSLGKIAKERSNINNVIPCKDCEVKYICGGDCRIKYFDSLLDCSSTQQASRQCNDTIKDNVYEQMLRTHEYLFV